MTCAEAAGAPHPDLVGLRKGNAEAISAVYYAHAGHLLRLAGRLLGDRAEAEDLVHDLFVGLPEASRRYEERGAFRAWLSGITVRMALMRLRRRKRRGEVPIPDGVSDAKRSIGDRVDDRLLITAALARLPADARLIVALRDIEGWTYHDIAAATGLTESALMTRHSRALIRLRTILEKIR